MKFIDWILLLAAVAVIIMGVSNIVYASETSREMRQIHDEIVGQGYRCDELLKVRQQGVLRRWIAICSIGAGSAKAYNLSIDRGRLIITPH